MSVTGAQRPARWRFFTGGMSLPAVVVRCVRLANAGSHERKVRPQLARLAGHEEALSRLATEVENKFLEIGAALQTGATLSGELVAQAGRLTQLGARNGADGHAAHAAVALVQRTLVFVEECESRTAELVARLDRYHEQTGRLLREEEQVERILAPLRTIQTLFRIESAILPPEMQAGFVALSGEIPKFEVTVRETFGRHAEALTETRRSIAITTERLHERADERREAISADRARIAESLAGLERELANTRERHARLTAIVGEIDRETRELVVNLQYQDITRQKMEHVRQALGEIRAHTDASKRRREGADPEYLRESCRLESMQAEAIQQELERAFAGIASGVQGIFDQLARAETECWPRAQFGRTAEAVAGNVAGLREVLQETSRLVPAALASAEEVLGIVTTFGDVASDVASTAREMAENMRMIALNAQVLAAQAGEQGAGLLILAERTYAISEEVRRITESIGREFVESAGQLRAVNEQCEALKTHARDRQQELAREREPITRELDAYRNGVQQLLGELGGLMERIYRHAGEMLGAARFNDDFCHPLAELREDLEQLASAAARAPGRASAETAAQLELIGRRYTMDAERHVLAAALAEKQTGSRAAVPKPVNRAEVPPLTSSAAPAATALGDNVELF